MNFIWSSGQFSFISVNMFLMFLSCIWNLSINNTYILTLMTSFCGLHKYILLHAYDFFHRWSSENINVTHNAYYKYTNYGIIIACNKPFIAWFARAYDPFSLSQKISLTRSFHSLVRDIFFARENVSYGLTTHAIIYIYLAWHQILSSL